MDDGPGSGSGAGPGSSKAGSTGKAGPKAGRGKYTYRTWPGKEGIYYREYEGKKDGRRLDRHLSCRYRRDGKRIIEPVGWLSELRNVYSVSPADGLHRDLLEVKANIKRGQGPMSIKDLWESRKDAGYEAEVKAREIRTLRLRDEILFRDVAGLYLDWCDNNRQDAGTQRGNFNRHILPELGERVFSSVTAEDVAALRAKVEKKHPVTGSGREDRTRRLKPQTVLHILKAVRELYNFAAEASHPEQPGQRLFTGANPARMSKRSRVLRPVAVKNRRLRIPTDAELAELFRYTGKGSQYEAVEELKRIFLFALDCGPRMGEVCQFRKEHFNPESGACSFVKGSRAHDGTKGEEDRIVFAGRLRPECLDMLREQAGRHPTSPYMFPGAAGTARDVSAIGRAFRRIASRYGWNEGILDQKFLLVPHSLRHRFATDYLEEFGDIYGLKTAMGHSDIETTEIYLHVCDPDKLAAARARAEEVRRILRERAAG